ncbi:MAG: MotA/TolQ/ExbB proton channel family protein [Chitinophagales bacterium]
MKKLSIVMALIAILTFGVNPNMSFAQDDAETTEEVAGEDSTAAGDEVVDEVVEETDDAANAADFVSDDAPEEEATGRKLMLEKFMEGGAGFMSIVLVCLIFGLAFCIERIISLSLASTNSKKLLQKIEDNLSDGNVEGAKEVCKSSRSPIASIINQGLERVNDGIDTVEKSVVAYGSIEMGRLEKGLTWISLAIALAPMLGFLGTVWGMIQAFDAIEAQGDISPTVVAGGIKVALLTTVFGLVVAIILQIFYNYIVSRVDSIVNDMEDASITFVDMLIRHKIVEK